MDSLAQDLLQELECPICMEYMIPPITICTNGHNICHSCKSTLQHCPTCRGKLADIRTRPMENLSNRITHPCKYRKSGCTAQCLVEFKEQHEKACLFYPRKCPIAICESKCTWEGSLLHLEEHVRYAKHYIYPENNLLRIAPFSDGPYLLYRGFIFILDEMFFAFSKRMENFLHVILTFVGNKEQAKNFEYKITVTSEDDERSISTCFTCLSYLEFLERPLTISDVRSAVFPANFWKNDTTLVDGKRVLPYTLEVMRSKSFDKKD